MLDMTRAEKSQLAAGMVSLAVYLVVAWVGATFFQVTLWRALTVLFVARAFFGVVETAAGVLNWRLLGKRPTVVEFLEVLRSNRFPQRFYRDDDFSNYLARIEDDNQFPESLRRAAKEFYRVLALSESQGILAGMRINAAAEAALEAYSPRARAPEML